MINAEEFAPKIRETTYRGQRVVEIDIRKWPEIAERIGAPLRKRFPNRKDAGAYYRRLLVAEAQDEPLEPKRVPVKRFFDRYLLRVEKAHRETRTARTYQQLLKPFLVFVEAVGIEDIGEIDGTVVSDYQEHELGRVAPTTARSELSVLHAAFNWGVKTGRIAINPAAGHVPKATAPERPTLTASQRRALVGDREPFSDYWRLLLLTGLRRAELLTLTIDKVHLDVPAPFMKVMGKGLKERVIPLVSLELDVVARLVRAARTRRTTRLCPLSATQLQVRWSDTRRRLKLDGLRMHDLRHDFISVLANGGVPLPVVQRLAGHSKLSTTAHYIHDDPAAMRAAMKVRSDGVQR